MGTRFTALQAVLPGITSEPAEALRAHLFAMTGTTRLLREEDLDENSRSSLLASGVALSSTAYGDTDGDGQPDVVAVLVSKIKGERRYSTAVFTSRRGIDESPIWITANRKEPIVGVSLSRVGDGRHVLEFNCLGCDSNNLYRWKGGRFVLE